MGRGQCQMCKRTLTDNESILRGVGPECEQKRARYLASLDTTEAELAALTASTSDLARRRMTAFAGALAAGNTRDAAIFLASARQSHAEEAQEQAGTAERDAVLAVLRKGAALFGYLDAQLARSGKVKDLYGVLAGMVRYGQIVKLGNGQYALPTAQLKADPLDSLREQYGQTAVDEYLWGCANSGASKSEILAAVIQCAKADAQALDGEVGILRDFVSERANAVRLDDELIWSEAAKAA